MALRKFFLVGGAGPFVTVARRQRFGCDLFHYVHGTAGANARRRTTQNLNGAEAIVAVDYLGTGSGLNRSNRAKRHHISVGAANVKAIDIGWISAKLRLGLNQHLPGVTETVEVVN